MSIKDAFLCRCPRFYYAKNTLLLQAKRERNPRLLDTSIANPQDLSSALR
jgi:hypothetical protein